MKTLTLFKKLSILLILGIYRLVSQFAFKAIATTPFEPIDLDPQAVCYGKKIDTYDNKTNCRKKTFNSQFQTTTFAPEIKKIIVFHLGSHSATHQYGTTPSYQHSFRSPRPPPDYVTDRVHRYTYTTSIKQLC